MKTPKNIANYQPRDEAVAWLKGVANGIRQSEDDAVFIVDVHVRKWRQAWTDQIERSKAATRSRRSALGEGRCREAAVMGSCATIMVF